MMHYFDHNATTPLCDPAREAWMRASSEHWGNASAGYQMGAKARAALGQARESMGAMLGVDPASLVFCSGATEACNLWLRSMIERLRPGQSVLVSRLDHSCVLEPLQALASPRIRWFRPGFEFNVRDLLEEAVRDDPGIAMVVMMAANNVTGECYDWRRAAAWCRERGFPFFCDATQVMGKLPLEGWDRVDAFCGSAHKFGGPKGMGFLRVAPRHGQVCGQRGGGQEGGVRAGTEDLPGILAMRAALEHSCDHAADADAIRQRLDWRRQFQDALAVSIPGIRFLVPIEASLWNTVSVILPRDPAPVWIEQLDRRGIAAAAGSACSTGHSGAARVLLEMGMDAEAATRHLRLSAGWRTTEHDWHALLKALTEIWRDGRKHGQTGRAHVISIDDL